MKNEGKKRLVILEKEVEEVKEVKEADEKKKKERKTGSIIIVIGSSSSC